MKDDMAAILMLNSLNKSSTSNSLVPGCYRIHIQTKFFFIAGLRNLVDRYKSCFSIPVTIFLSLIVVGPVFLSSCKTLSTSSPSLCCKTSAILVTSRLLAAKVCSLLLFVAVEGYCWQLLSTLLQLLLHNLPL